ncbi:protein-tyrosine phosphatase family protein [Cellulomonas shaoxiangyii]|uniref:Tyrosine specific protein phosphatases domain-containing protein n=1 Tax=Cellulomonas shaoxiangyii TaxID=2566013 RepID=A0A4P7SJ70_9CELL|nr:protein-tyrosine phosphatase family protein [Cellulomonas shaoxiangyii]QCB93537.1 hypothetical protein E5225_08150 [Cellulomonas shaoxiangyii]TGY86859.1 hypothetical protein E5226_00470 [Cellulomonas shaoxiangyii]
MSSGAAWDSAEAGVVTFPSGARIRGRRVRDFRDMTTLPDLAVILSGTRPRHRIGTDTRWIRWPDFWLPVRPADARAVLDEARAAASTSRVDVACRGGVGRTGTALACIAVLDGVPASAAVQLVRRQYDARAIETPWQRRYVAQLARETPRRGHGA